MKNKTVEVSQNAIIFFGLVMVGILGYGGYLYGKVSTLEKTGVVAGAVAPTPQAAGQQAQQPATTAITIDQVRGLFGGGNITFGDKNSKLVFVEFSDPSCPYCHVAAGKNSELNKQMGAQFLLKADGGTYLAPVAEIKKMVDEGKAAFVWMYANGHGNGEMATKALYCGHEEGKFWQIHDLLMTNKGYELINTTVKNDKTQAGVMAEFLKGAVNLGEMKTCLESGKYDGRMASDMAVAQQFGFNGTPSFFVNTKNFAGAYNFTDMKSAVDAAGI